MGVIVPKIKAKKVEKHFTERGYGLLSSSSKIDESAYAYEKVVDKVILAAEIETSMKKVLKEIEKTKRRVNALEYVVIPKMMHQMEFIRLRLEEMERENIFRLKRIKGVFYF
jgi:V/A-type H+-transporting ATPase subunit D